MAKPMTTISHRIHSDVIEFLTEKILFEEENRLENWKALEVSIV
jgi:hypothetical protein